MIIIYTNPRTLSSLIERISEICYNKLVSDFMKKIVSVFLATILAFASYAQTPSIPENADFWSEYPNEALADFLISKMSNEELLAQIFMFGWAEKNQASF